MDDKLDGIRDFQDGFDYNNSRLDRSMLRTGNIPRKEKETKFLLNKQSKNKDNQKKQFEKSVIKKRGETNERILKSQKELKIKIS